MSVFWNILGLQNSKSVTLDIFQLFGCSYNVFREKRSHFLFSLNKASATVACLASKNGNADCIFDHKALFGEIWLSFYTKMTFSKEKVF